MRVLREFLIVVIFSAIALAQNSGALAIPKEKLPPVPPVRGPAAVDCSVGDQTTHDACVKAITASYQYDYESHMYDIESLHHRAASIQWSLFASQVMFGVVLILVFSGLAFAAIQFRLAMRAPVTAPETDAKPAKPVTATGSDLSTQLEVTEKGLKIQSSVLGVIILALSMAFFYLYAEFVYPIHELTHQSNDVAQGPSR